MLDRRRRFLSNAEHCMNFRLPYMWLVLTLLFGIFANAEERGTPEEAKAMVSRAIALFDEDEADAIARFNDQHDDFLDRDLYLFVLDPDDTVIAHAYKPAKVGIDARTVHDSTGLPIWSNDTRFGERPRRLGRLHA